MKSLNEIKKSCKGPFYLERKFYYYCSIRVVYFLQNTRISPDIITLLSFFTVLIAFYLIAFTNNYSFIISSFVFILLNISNILDAVDGQLARITKNFSTYGWLYDEVLDLFKQSLVISAVAIWYIKYSNKYFAVIFCMTLLFFILFKYIFRQILRNNINDFFDKLNDSVLPEYISKIILLIDKIFLRLKLGMFTVGEFYLVISFSILFNAVTFGLIVLIFYSFLVSFFELFRLIDSVKRLKCKTKYDKNILVFGTGAASDKIYNLLKNKYNIIGFVDKDVKNNSTKKYSIPIISEMDLYQYDEPILIASDWYREIIERLSKTNTENIIPFVF